MTSDTKTLFLLSGENPTLPFAELNALHRIFEPAVQPHLADTRIAFSGIDPAKAKVIAERSAYSKMVCSCLAHGPIEEMQAAVQEIPEEALDKLHLKASSFRVRVTKLQGAQADSVGVEKELCRRVLALQPQLRLDLSKPELTFAVIITPSTYFVGLLRYVRPARQFSDRLAKQRPFMTPSTLQPKLARCMVNLGANAPACNILDPFSGSGAILVECGLLGHPYVGLEIAGWISRGCLRNLKAYLAGEEMVVQADARQPPLRRGVGSIVTDPPYGRSASISGKSLPELMEDFFSNIGDVMAPSGRMCLASPLGKHIGDIAVRQGFSVKESHRLYVHGTLTREVMVLEP